MQLRDMLTCGCKAKSWISLFEWRAI